MVYFKRMNVLVYEYFSKNVIIFKNKKKKAHEQSIYQQGNRSISIHPYHKNRYRPTQTLPGRLRPLIMASLHPSLPSLIPSVTMILARISTSLWCV